MKKERCAVLTAEERYAIFIDTLNLLILPEKKIGKSYLSLIEYKLEELEGDYFTFLHEDNVMALVDSGHISTELIGPIAQIRKQIDEIEPSKWVSSDFIDNIMWKHVRELILSLFKTEILK